MGGTSTDVSRFDGRFEYEQESRKAGVRVLTPSLAIETVAAGGGSICDFDGSSLRVGPQSAGADPGPACYGRGGPLTVTDVNLFLGRLRREHFPFQLDEHAVREHLERFANRLTATSGRPWSPVELADGFRCIANANMVRAIHRISVAKGCDPREYVLVAFGGAAPQHACAVAQELGIQKVLIHPDASLLSALAPGWRIFDDNPRLEFTERLEEIFDVELPAIFHRLDASSRKQLDSDWISPEAIRSDFQLDIRYSGSDAAFTVPWNIDLKIEDVRTTFERLHRRLYGYVYPGRSLEVVAARAEAIVESSSSLPPSRPHEPYKPMPCGSATIGGQVHQPCQVYRMIDLHPGAYVVGPALVLDEHSTTVVEQNWTAELLSQGELLLSNKTVSMSTSNSSTFDPNSIISDPVQVEIFQNKFFGIAERMGEALRNTASSVNVKERLDFSCAIFSAKGDLVVNAPHVPVHLGAMGESVRHIIRSNPQLLPGDVYVTNDPYYGGSHLPDVTVITPVHDPENGELAFFTANRAHHAEIGGITPGSMPAFSRSLAEEGVVIHNFRLVEGISFGTSNDVTPATRFEELRKLLMSGRYPSRSPETNLADVAAQVAANQLGVISLSELMQRHGRRVVTAYMQFVQETAERKMRLALSRIPSGDYAHADQLDDHSPIAVSIRVRGESAEIDFAGTGPVVRGNLNANRAIVTAAVLYCLRCLIGEAIPLNQGVLAPSKLSFPYAF